LTASWVALACLLLSVVIGIYAARHPKAPGAAWLVVMAAGLAVWSVLYLPGIATPTKAGAVLSLLCGQIVGSAMLLFALIYGRRPEWTGPNLLVPLVVVPIMTVVLFWASPGAVGFQGDLTNTAVQAVGSQTTLHAAYLLLLGVGTFVLLMDAFRRSGGRRSLRSAAMLLAVGASLVLEILVLARASMPVPVDPLLTGLLICLTGLWFGLYGSGRLDPVPIPRRYVVDRMPDGWLMLDEANRIIDINAAAEDLLGVTRADVRGLQISAVLTDVPNLGNALDGNQDLEMRRRVRSQENWRYLSIRVLSLQDHRDRPLGKLVVCSDQTKQRLAEDARYRARDEMFVLLNTISSAASNFVELDDFLAEVTYQIIHPFHSQLVAIFLLDERGQQPQDQSLYLASHLGLPDEIVDSLTSLPFGSPVLDSLQLSRQPLAIDDIAGDDRTPDAMRQLNFAHLVISPLIPTAAEGGRIIGLICLARREDPAYSADELIRLGEVSEQIATLIDSTRRSKLAIALSERQNLIKDLHDSVSQKLYALVTMTEAAQASLEAGGRVDLNQILTRMGENARQAAREMRLFLYQLRPADIEKDGLIGAIHHRLSAVEGRASVKARLLADDGIVLSKDKEVALYYIAQEALNNIIRHAYAQTVLVTLKKEKQQIVLEVRDDGKGFDAAEAQSGGMGLQNIRERTMQINGRLRIVSKPGQGTRVIITVPVERAPRTAQRRLAS